MRRQLPITLLIAAAVAAVFALFALGCGAATEPEPEAEVDAPDHARWMLEHTDDYLHDASWRRAQLEASLWRPELPYARKRLTAYALEDSGWDLLPKIDARVMPVGNEPVGNEPAFDGRRITPEQTPQTYDEWLALGEDVFWSMPMRRDTYLKWLVERPDLWDEVGFETREDGTLRGLVRYEDDRGRLRTAATCGLCHGARGEAGRAARELDLGRGRELFARARGAEPGAYTEWPAGTVDVTDDGVTDPLSIPDLWGLSHARYINSSAAVRVASPASLAIRFETQYIPGHSMEARPDRRLTWALAMYVLSLERPARPDTQPRDTSAGLELFEQHCADCHLPDEGFGGDLVEADELPVDQKAAHSAFRGTGFYKVPSLIGISEAAPYLHDASAPTLRAFLDNGHPELTDAQRDQLIDYLETL
ncbi:MAG: c-type cytochrome [Persicimonas sp.]